MNTKDKLDELEAAVDAAWDVYIYDLDGTAASDAALNAYYAARKAYDTAWDAAYDAAKKLNN